VIAPAEVEQACHPAAPAEGWVLSFTKTDGRSVQSATVRVTAVLLEGLELASDTEGAEGTVVSRVMFTVEDDVETLPTLSFAQTFKAWAPSPLTV
jgi:hypothetical protein